MGMDPLDDPSTAGQENNHGVHDAVLRDWTPNPGCYEGRCLSESWTRRQKQEHELPSANKGKCLREAGHVPTTWRRGWYDGIGMSWNLAMSLTATNGHCMS